MSPLWPEVIMLAVRRRANTASLFLERAIATFPIVCVACFPRGCALRSPLYHCAEFFLASMVFTRADLPICSNDKRSVAAIVSSHLNGRRIHHCHSHSVWSRACANNLLAGHNGCDFRGSVFHSVIVSETGSSSLNRPSCTAASAAIPQKLFVPLKIGHRLFPKPPFA